MWVRECENLLFNPSLIKLVCFLMLLPAVGWSQLSLTPQNMDDVVLAKVDENQEKVPAILDEETMAVVQGIQYDSSFVGKKAPQEESTSDLFWVLPFIHIRKKHHNSLSRPGALCQNLWRRGRLSGTDVVFKCSRTAKWKGFFRDGTFCVHTLFGHLYRR